MKKEVLSMSQEHKEMELVVVGNLEYIGHTYAISNY